MMNDAYTKQSHCAGFVRLLKRNTCRVNGDLAMLLLNVQHRDGEPSGHIQWGGGGLGYEAEV